MRADDQNLLTLSQSLELTSVISILKVGGTNTLYQNVRPKRVPTKSPTKIPNISLLQWGQQKHDDLLQAGWPIPARKSSVGWANLPATKRRVFSRWYGPACLQQKLSTCRNHLFVPWTLRIRISMCRGLLLSFFLFSSLEVQHGPGEPPRLNVLESIRKGGQSRGDAPCFGLPPVLILIHLNTF